MFLNNKYKLFDNYDEKQQPRCPSSAVLLTDIQTKKKTVYYYNICFPTRDASDGGPGPGAIKH